MEIPIDITNQTSRIIIQTTEPEFALVGIILTVFLIAGTLLGVYFSNRSTIVSNNLMREEMKTRLRPWMKIGLIEMKSITWNDEHSIPWDEKVILDLQNHDKIKHVTMGVLVTNVGNLPTSTRFHTWLYQKDKFDREVLRKKGERLEKGPLMPTESITYYFDIPIDVWKGKKGEVLFHTGIEVDYKIDKSTNYRVGKIWRVYHETCLLTDTGYWIN